jgi:hypothetical protein
MALEPSNSFPQGRRLITSFFSRRDDARSAIETLKEEGVSPADIDLIEARETTTGETRRDAEGVWASLKGFLLADAPSSATDVQGGCLVAVRGDDASCEVIADILDRAGAVDIRSRAGNARPQARQEAGLAESDGKPGEGGALSTESLAGSTDVGISPPPEELEGLAPGPRQDEAGQAPRPGKLA